MTAGELFNPKAHFKTNTPPALWGNPTIAAADKVILAILIDFGWKDGLAYPGLQTIESRTGFGERYIYKRLVFLEKKLHAIRRVTAGIGRGNRAAWAFVYGPVWYEKNLNCKTGFSRDEKVNHGDKKPEPQFRETLNHSSVAYKEETVIETIRKQRRQRSNTGVEYQQSEPEQAAAAADSSLQSKKDQSHGTADGIGSSAPNPESRYTPSETDIALVHSALEGLVIKPTDAEEILKQAQPHDHNGVKVLVHFIKAFQIEKHFAKQEIFSAKFFLGPEGAIARDLEPWMCKHRSVIAELTKPDPCKKCNDTGLVGYRPGDIDCYYRQYELCDCPSAAKQKPVYLKRTHAPCEECFGTLIWHKGTEPSFTAVCATCRKPPRATEDEICAAADKLGARLGQRFECKKCSEEGLICENRDTPVVEFRFCDCRRGQYYAAERGEEWRSSFERKSREENAHWASLERRRTAPDLKTA